MFVCLFRYPCFDLGSRRIRDEFILALRIQECCLIYWPLCKLYHSTSGRDEDANDENHLIFQSNWFIYLCHLIEALSPPSAALEYPGYDCPDSLIVQHIHFERLTSTYSMLYPIYNPTITSPTNTQSDYLRVFFVCEFASVHINTALELGDPKPRDASKGPAGTSRPGVFIMAFLNNSALFLFPTKFESMINSSTKLHPALDNFCKWLDKFDFHQAVCVASLDHLEIRCFSEPISLDQRVNKINK